MRIMSWEDKHSTSFYDASTRENLELAARSVIKDLVEIGYVYEPDAPDDLNDEEKSLLTLSEEEIEALPPVVKKDITTKIKNLVEKGSRLNSHYQSEKCYYDNIVAIAAGETPWQCIRLKSKYSVETWNEIIEAYPKWPGAELREDGIYSPISAWGILQDRQGEYERYELHNVITFDEKE